ncbi:hypothetical protein M770_33780 (plasmid) [Pseudomonas aeruginosa VRFPA03]|nr:hypothetical protein M770_33780 [Pseudomonas aeruginosa VRFPA03]
MPDRRTLLLTVLAMLAFAGNSLLCRAALKDTAIDAVSFTALRLFSGALMLAVLLSRIDHARLRAACPCAQCRAQRLRGRIVAAEQGVRLRDIRLQGYGVQLLFDDGHERGIYPWSYLRDEL